MNTWVEGDVSAISGNLTSTAAGGKWPISPSARSNAVAFALGNAGFVGTGFDGLNSFNDFFQFDPAANLWAPKASFPGLPRYDAVAFAVNGKGYIGTGYNTYWMNDFYQYDPQKDAWLLTQGTSENFSKRQGASTFVYQDKAYIVGGSNNNQMVRDFWQFDPSQSSSWKRLSDITNTSQETFDDGYKDIERQYAVAFVNGAQAYLTTGTNGTQISSTWVYDILSDRWSERSPYPRQPRNGAIAFTVSERSFVGLGNSGGNVTFDDLEQFLPTVPFNANDY